MLCGKDKALLVKPFYMNVESVTVALLKSRLQKKCEEWKKAFNSGRPHKACSAISENWIARGSYKIWTTKSEADTFGARNDR
ncbi:hypothetical protein NPIL_571741, partial [Nephila pilipes]